MSVEPLDHHDNADAWPWILESSLRCYPAHLLVGADSAWVLVALAVSDFAAIRCAVFDMTDVQADLHATVSLLRQGRAFVPDVAAAPRAQECSWSEIAHPARGLSCCRSASLSITVTDC